MTHTTDRFHLDKYEGFLTLMVDGVILSVDISGGDPPFGYWTAMLPERPPRSALLLGLGGGTLAHLLARRYPHVEITGIDNDSELIAFARQHFALDLLSNLTIVIDDAFRYAAACREVFEYVAVDLFRGREFLRSCLSRPFLRHVKRVAGPDGEIAMNLFHDGRSNTNLSRVGRILPITRIDRLPQNIVVHCAAD